MDRFKRFSQIATLLSILLILIGLCMIIWPDVSALTLCYAIGIVALVMGAIGVIRYFRVGSADIFFRSDLALGLIGILAGLLFVLHPKGIIDIFHMLIGFYVIVTSVFGVQAALDMKRVSLPRWIPALILSIVSLVFGFLLVLNPFGGAKALMIMTGVALVVNGVENISCMLTLKNAVKSGTKINAGYIMGDDNDR